MTDSAESPGVDVGATWFRTTWRRLVRRPGFVGASLVIASLVSSALASFAHWPQPAAHDEFSYLLASDTFCEGRLTNPTHPHWEHFESFHIFHQPSYASKYPPGQGAALALGQWLTNNPLCGVWIESALAVAAVYWMLLAWTSPRWAFLGAVLLLVHPHVQLEWGQSYWGGTLAYVGGTLVFGAATRMTRRVAALDAVALAAGATVLAATRPFEGFVFCLLIGGWVAHCWIRQGLPPRREWVLKTVLPAAVLLLGGLAALGAYHAAVTGDPFTMPYIVHERAYAQCPMFLGQLPAQPEYRHNEIERFHSGWAMSWYHWQSTFRGLLYTKFAVTWVALQFLLSPALAVGLLLMRPLRWRRYQVPLLIALLTFLVSLASIWNFPHYMAPFAPVLLLAAAAGLRRLDVLCRRRRLWLRLGSSLVAVQAALFLVAAVKYGTKPYAGWWDVRAAIVAQLERLPGDDLVFVRYSSEHNTGEEWVYNAADIDASPIVWARSMNPAKDAELLAYFHDRQPWLLEPDSRSLKKIECRPAQFTAVSASP